MWGTQKKNQRSLQGRKPDFFKTTCVEAKAPHLPRSSVFCKP